MSVRLSSSPIPDLLDRRMLSTLLAGYARVDRKRRRASEERGREDEGQVAEMPLAAHRHILDTF